MKNNQLENTQRWKLMSFQFSSSWMIIFHLKHTVQLVSLSLSLCFIFCFFLPHQSNKTLPGCVRAICPQCSCRLVNATNVQMCHDLLEFPLLSHLCANGAVPVHTLSEQGLSLSSLRFSRMSCVKNKKQTINKKTNHTEYILPRILDVDNRGTSCF